MVALGSTETALTFGLAAAMFGLGHGLMYPTMAAYSIDVVPGGHLRAMTIWSGGFIVGMSIGSWFAGVASEYVSIGAAFRLSALMPVTALFLVWLGSHRRVRPLRHDQP